MTRALAFACRWAFALFGAGFLAACGSTVEIVEWTIELTGSGVEDETRNVRAFILRGGCESEERIYAIDLDRLGEGSSPGALPPGVYGFGAEAMDAACAPVARGCVQRRLPEESDVPVAIPLEPGPGAARCGPGQCVDGRCVPNPTMDGGPAPEQDASMPDDCPEGIRRPEGACYRYYDITTDFNDGRELCALWDADLYVPSNGGEERWVNESIDVSGDYWIGLTDAETEGEWVRVDGTSSGYTNWDGDNDEPNGGEDSNCARYDLETEAWRDYSCASEFGVICERP